MSASTTFSPLLQIPIKKLPPRVITEVFPIFENVLTPETHVAIGVSSGVDSMSVACLLIIRYAHKNFPLSHLHIIHCNHKLRKQSEVEEQFMQDFFKGIPLHVYHRPPTLWTTEKTLREWRYSCFRETEVPFLFLWHHLEDRIESTFLHCIRGAGLKGFVNMQILQKHQLLPGVEVCRPLLTITKGEIIAFCKKYKIRSFEDETNSDISTSQRNFIRHEILEKLVSRNCWKSRFLESMKNIYKEIEPMMEKGKEGISFHPISASPARNAEYAYRVSPWKGGFNATKLLQLRNHLNIATNLRSSQIQERTTRLTHSQSGRKEFHGIYFFFHEKQLYIITSFLPYPFRTVYLTDEKIIKKLWPQTLAGITIEANEERFLWTTLRFPKPGDHFAGKTRNRRCINQKIPLFRRNFLPLAVKDGEIIHMWKSVMNEKSNQK